MALLISKTRNQTLLSELKQARGFWQRGIGLLGTKSLSDEQALWILRCNAIHTYFMKFAIDCVFMDKHMKVCAIVRDVKPGKLVWPIWKASSVIEMKAGLAERIGLTLGEELHVGT